MYKWLLMRSSNSRNRLMSKINVGNPRLSSNSLVTGWADGNSLAKWFFGMSWIISFTLNLPQMWRSSIIPAEYEGCLSSNGFILNDSFASRSGRQHKHFLFPFHSRQCFKNCPFPLSQHLKATLLLSIYVRSEGWQG